VSDAPPVRYARMADGTAIAYSVHGSGPALLYCRGHGHLEFEWTIPETREWFERLGGAFTVIRYDAPGTGMSDRDGDFWGAVGLDARTVLDASGFETAAFFGEGTGNSPRSALTLASVQERISAGVLWCHGLGGLPARVAALRAVGDIDEQLYHDTLLLWHGWANAESRHRMYEMRRISGLYDQLEGVLRNADEHARQARAALATVEVATLLIAKRDAITSLPEQADALARILPRSERRTLDGRGAHPQLDD